MMFEVRAFYHTWAISCWKCGRETPVLWALRPPTNEKEEDFDQKWIGAYEVNPDQDTAMGRAIASRIQWFRMGHSHTMGGETYASFCTHCESLQGNWYVGKDLFMQLTNGYKPDFSNFVDYNTDHDAVAYLNGN